MTACTPGCLCHRIPPQSPLVATLAPGQKVRVQIAGYDRPFVGFLRRSANSVLATHDHETLYLDVRQGFIVRGYDGSPGFSVRSVEVLSANSDTREERLEAIDTAADEWLIAVDALDCAPASERQAALVAAQEAYSACLAAFGAPHEVTEGAA